MPNSCCRQPGAGCYFLLPAPGSLSRRALILRASKRAISLKGRMARMESRYHAQSVAKPLTRSIFLKNALNFAERNIPTFPLKGKAPLTPHGFRDATTDPRRLHLWGNRYPGANTGIPTGSISGIVVVDLDDETPEAMRIWNSLPETVEVETGRGRHRYYKIPKDARVRSRKLTPDLDLKADGGYVVAPPSVHPSGARYRWVEGHSEIAELPAHLLEPEAKSHDASPKPENRAARATSFEDDGGPIYEGVRNRSLFFMALALKDNGASRESALETLLTQNQSRCVPALEESEVQTIVKSAFRYPVRGSRTPPEVLEALELLKHQWWSEAWRGVGGKTERDIVRVLIQMAERYGQLIRVGVRVTLSIRDLALASGCSRKTVERVTKRLRLSGWLRGDNGLRTGTDAGAFVLLARLTDDTQSMLPRASTTGSSVVTSSRLPEITPCFRWRGFVGKGKAGVLYALEVFGEQTLEELATRLGFSRARDLRRLYLEPLAEMGLIKARDDTYALPETEAYAERVEDIRTSRYGGGSRKERRKDANGRRVTHVVEVPPKSEVERTEEERVKYEAERGRYRTRLEEAA